ncbi:hypothetical protein B7494_g4249 [Chlorociboria aeruginascens]|nr:hypothetical protein B7494_g4249 [Chlorociboria aeruginascens]
MKPKYTQPAIRLISHRPCNCICQRHHNAHLARSYTNSPPSAGFTHLPSRRLISLLGPDSTHYLQGVITSNISPSTARTSGFYSAFLSAQGRVLNDVFIYPFGNREEKEGWLIEVDAAEAERLAKHIKRYKLRAKFDVRVLDEGERNVWSVWKEEGWKQHGMAGPESADSEEIGCEDLRAPGMGRRLILPSDRRPEVDSPEATEESYTIRRYLRGVAEGQSEILREVALPQESNIDFMGGIDYRKGCYVGQELTIRTHHTGVVRKRILPVMVYATSDPEPQTLEYLGGDSVENVPRETSIGRWEKRGRSAGKFLKGVGNIGLGLCRLEIMSEVLVQGEAGGYKVGDEFKVEWGEDGEKAMLKIKAFVPAWHLSQTRS